MQTHICSNASAELTAVFFQHMQGPDSQERNFSYSPICNKTGDYKAALKAIWQKNFNNLIVAHLKVNSLSNKLELLCDQIKGTIDVLMISETKIDDNSPIRNSSIDG